MNEKDLFKGLNHIDEELVDEAGKPIEDNKHSKKNIFLSNLHTIGTIAAVLAVIVLSVKVVNLNSTLKESGYPYSNNKVDKTDEEITSTNEDVVVNDDLGEKFIVAKGYDDLYDRLQTIQDNFRETNESEDGVVIEEDSISIEEGMSSTDSINEVAEMDNAKNELISSDIASSQKQDHSSTNIMTQGVDESDIVKTDGKYIYMVESSWISITDISKGKPGERKPFTPDFDSPADVVKDMYVEDGRMFLIVSHIVANSNYNEETVCYSYDISDVMNPKLIGKMKQEGHYNTSRKIGDTVYLFTMKRIEKPDMNKEEALKEDSLNEWIPLINDAPIEYDCIYMGNDSFDGMLISSFDINNPKETIDSKYVMTGYSDVYVSNDAIYYYESKWTSGRSITNISKMKYNDGKLTAGKSTMINGSIEDSFAISQQNGYLYVIATEDNSDISVNTLHVFDDEMKQTGVINDIARDEKIYAARFLGDYAYFITYRQIDPLFVADISDPENPKLLGELEVEGFSEYLHIWDEKHVLGIGYITKQNARDRIRLTMFDVSDPQNPVEENSYILNNSDYCDALQGNYKAILADPKKNLIGFAAGDTYSLFEYDKKNGFSLIRDTVMKYDKSEAYRGLYSGDNFYVAGAGQIEYFKLK